MKAKFQDVVLNRRGEGIAATIHVYQPGTTTPVGDPLYDKDDVVLTNPLTANSQGEFEFYMDSPQRVKLVVSASGHPTPDIREVDVLSPDVSGGAHPSLATHDTLGLATQAELDTHTASPHAGVHPDLATHDALGLATDAELTAHAATSHGGAHPNLATHDTLGLATDAELSTHASDTTSVHGITNTTVLATDAEVTNAVANHEADTSVHGIADTTVLATDTEVATAVSNHDSDTSVHGIADTSVLATDAEVATAVSDHETAVDPHGGYLTPTEGDAAYEIIGTVATHEAATEPHVTRSVRHVINQTGHGLVVGDVVRFDGINYVKARADTAANAEVVGIVSALAGANDFTFTSSGKVSGLTGLTAGTDYFLSPTTAGLLTATPPSTNGQVVKPLFIADTATTGYFFNQRSIVVEFDDHSARHEVAGADTLTTYTPRASVATYAGRSNRTAGNLTLNSVTYADLPSLAGITLSAATGDWVEVGFFGTWQNEAVECYLDAVSSVTGSPVSSWGLDGAAGSETFQGVPHWLGVPSLYSYVGGTVFKKLVAGDISAGTVVIGLRYRTSAAANKVLVANTDNPISFWARNHG